MYLNIGKGGQVVSIPKDYVWRLSQKELLIYDQFTGSNYDELARSHGFTVRGMRKLIARVKDKIKRQHRDDRQADLLDPPDEQPLEIQRAKF